MKPLDARDKSMAAMNVLSGSATPTRAASPVASMASHGTIHGATNLMSHSIPNAETGTMETEYAIGELAREFDLTLRTLRFYEDKGLLRPPPYRHAAHLLASRQGSAEAHCHGQESRLLAAGHRRDAGPL